MNFNKLYEDLDIKIRPLDDNYTPDNYAKQIMGSYRYQKGVVYTNTTSAITRNVDSNLLSSKQGV